MTGCARGHRPACNQGWSATGRSDDYASGSHRPEGPANNNVTSLPQNVAVVIDGWNALRGADQVLDFGDQIDRYVIDFGKLPDEIAAQRNRPSRVVSVTVVIGVHNRAQNPRARMIADQNIRFWQRDKRVRDCTFNGVTPIQEVTNEHAGRVGTAAGRDGGR